MKKKQECRIVADTENRFYVERNINGIGWTRVVCHGKGQAGLEACQDWLAKQQKED